MNKISEMAKKTLDGSSKYIYNNNNTLWLIKAYFQD